MAVAQIVLGRRRRARELAAIALHAALVAVMIADIPALAHHSSMAARSLEQNFIALITAAGWPLITHDWMVRYRVLAVLLINAPLLLVALSVLRDRPGVADRRWCLLGLGAWVALQIMAIAYGRASAVWASRYYDIFTFGLVVNGACALALCALAPARIAAVARVAVALWFGTILFGLAQKARETLAAEVTRKHAESQIQAGNVKRFLASGDFAHLRDKPPMHIPYPSAERLRETLSDPVIRGILPPALLGKEAPRRLDVSCSATVRCWSRSVWRCC